MECLNPFPIVFKDTYELNFDEKAKEKIDMIFSQVEPYNNPHLERGGGTSSISRTYTTPPHERPENQDFKQWLMDRANMIADIWNFDARFKRSEPVRQDYHMAQYDFIPIHVETNDVLFFPGWLSHKTEKNVQDDKRYVMSWNISAMEPIGIESPKEPREVLAERLLNSAT